MKKYLLAGALAAAAATCATAASAETLNISLKHFCDTFTLTINGFEINGTRQGCGNSVIDGGTAAKVGKSYNITNDSNDGAEIFTWYFTPPFAHNRGKWYLYEETGTSIAEINSGTYTDIASGSAQRGARSATAGGTPKSALVALPQDPYR